MRSKRGSREATRTSWASTAAPLLILLLLAGLFFLSFFNRFAGLRSGAGEFSGGMALLAGRLPYRDYYTAGPPLNQIKSAIELLIFGKLLIVSRAAAALERLGIAILLYRWLLRNFSPVASMLASLATIIVSAGDRSDPLASYNHDAILFAMVCGFAASRSLDSSHRRGLIYWAALAGAGAGLSTVTKQTVGLGVGVAVLVIASLAWIRRRPRMLAWWLPAYLTGFSVPVLVVALYLQRIGVLRAAVQMLFVSGPSAKAGHPSAFVQRALFIGWDNKVWVMLGSVALFLSGKAVWHAMFDLPGLPPGSTFGAARCARPSSPQSHVLGVVLLTGIGLLGVCELLSRLGVPAVWNFSKCAVYYTLFGTTIFGCALLWQSLRGRTHEARHWDLAMLAAVSWSVAFTLSLSWPAFEAMTLPGLGLLLAATFDGLRHHRWLFYSLLAVLMCFQVREKLDLPFTFGSQDEPPVRLATARSSLPMLRGMRLPPTTVRLLEDVTHTVDHDTEGSDTIFTYPEMGLLYTLADRVAPTRAGSHNIDVVPDWLARDEAHRLLAHPPAVVLYAPPSEEQLRAEETLWRDGQRSGQRDIINAVNQITNATSSYVLTETFTLGPGDNPIRLYVRRDRTSAKGAGVGRCGSKEFTQSPSPSCAAALW